MINTTSQSEGKLLPKQKSNIDSPTYSYLSGIGTAKTIITSSKRGRIRLFGSWWSAISVGNIIIQPDQKIRIIGREGMVLIVEPIKET
ncbi:MAG: NfeD family protein [Bacteroidota bacterium]